LQGGFTVDFRTRYPDFAPIEQQIRDARLMGAVVVSSAIAEFLVDCWNALKQPAAPAAILIDRRHESRANVTRITTRLAHR
jgi:hypothetical protein